MLSLMIGNIFWMTLIIFIFFMAVYINSVLKFLFISYRKILFFMFYFLTSWNGTCYHFSCFEICFDFVLNL